MKAVVLDATGGPEQLVLRDVPDPVAGERQVVVNVRAAGVNFADVLVRRGMYPQMPELPAILGSEVAGEVDGRRVMALVRAEGGGYAERVAVDAARLVDLPEGATFAEGASFLLAFVTAWVPLTQIARVGFGSRVLVTAAAGAVGCAAIQVVKALNGQPVAAVGSDEKRNLPLSLGAVEAHTYDDLEGIAPVTTVLDMVGGDVFTRSVKLLDPLGTAIAVGYAGGLWEPVEPQRLVGRNVGVHGFYLGRLMGLRPQLVDESVRDVLRMWEHGVLRPVVGAEFPLDEAGEAHRLIEERRSTGKVVLIP